jgi:hypothetical protein
VRVQPHEFVLPPTPPPEFDLEAWLETLDEIERRAPAQLALIHFGVAEDVDRHLRELRARLQGWTDHVGGGATREEFIAAREAELAELGRDAAAYDQAIPFWQSYLGLERYWRKQRDAA